MRVMGIKVSSKCVRYAILEKSPDVGVVFLNKEDNRLTFPQDSQGEAEKMVWLFNEFTRLLGMNPDIEKVIVKLPESGRMESKASRLSHYLDAMVFLGSAKQNPPIACTGVQYRTLHTRSADVLDFVLSKGICRTLHHWDSKIGDAIAAALSGLE